MFAGDGDAAVLQLDVAAATAVCVEQRPLPRAV
jgi:hypothetical protein